MKENNLIIHEINTDEKYIMVDGILCALNPEMTDIERVTHMCWGWNGINFIFFEETGDSAYVTLDDAMKYIERLLSEYAQKFHPLLKEIICWFVSIKNDMAKPINAQHNKAYCRALLKAYPQFENAVWFKKYYQRGVELGFTKERIKSKSSGKTKTKTPKGYVYFIKGNVTGNIKIGFSMHPEKRVKQLQTGAGEKLELLCKIQGSQSKERELHRKFKKQHIHGDWFHPSPELESLIHD